MSSFNDKGFVIKLLPLNDNDKIIEIISENNGRISAVAKGINKIRSRKAGSLDLCNHISFRAYEGRGGLGLIIESKLINDFHSIKKDYDNVNICFYILELIDKTITGYEKNRNFFQLLFDFFTLLDDKNILSNLEYLLIFQIKLLSELGYSPLLNECVICGEKLLEQSLRIPSIDNQVGYICDHHFNNQPTNLVPDVVIKIQKFIVTHSMHAGGRLNITPNQIRSIFSVQHLWLQNIIEKKINTTDIINSILLNLKEVKNDL